MNQHVFLINLRHMVLEPDPVERVCLCLFHSIDEALLVRVEPIFSALVCLFHLIILDYLLEFAVSRVECSRVHEGLIFGVYRLNLFPIALQERLKVTRILQVVRFFRHDFLPLLKLRPHPFYQVFLFLHYNVKFQD